MQNNSSATVAFSDTINLRMSYDSFRRDTEDPALLTIIIGIFPGLFFNKA